MNSWALWIVVSKEVRDALRDRRAVMAGLLFALLGPMLLAVALKAMIAAERDGGQQPVHVIGAALAPGLVAHLLTGGLVLDTSAQAPAELLARDPAAVVLVVPTAAPAALAQGRQAMLELWADMSDGEVRRRAQRVQELVAGYGMQLTGQRLLAAGVASGSAAALVLDLRDMGSQGGKAALVLGLLPVFWLLGVFVGGAHVALDVTGGERERHSLEALLAQPLAPGVLFAGKWLAASLFGYATGAATLLLSAVVLGRLPLYEVSVAFAPDAAVLARMLLVLLPMALLVGALQCTLALHARSHKEAQTYLNLLQLAPMALVVGQLGTSSPAAQLLPMLSQHAQLAALLAGQSMPPLPQLLSLGISLAAAGLLAWAGSRRLGSERFVFGL